MTEAELKLWLDNFAENITEIPDCAENLGDDLWVLSVRDSNYLSFAFFSGTEVAESMIMYGHGYIKLRECRHTYWGDEGYIYFPSKIQFIKIFDWLEAQGFDLD